MASFASRQSMAGEVRAMSPGSQSGTTWSPCNSPVSAERALATHRLPDPGLGRRPAREPHRAPEVPISASSPVVRAPFWRDVLYCDRDRGTAVLTRSRPGRAVARTGPLLRWRVARLFGNEAVARVGTTSGA